MKLEKFCNFSLMSKVLFLNKKEKKNFIPDKRKGILTLQFGKTTAYAPNISCLDEKLESKHSVTF